MTRKYRGRKSNYRKKLESENWRNVARLVRLRDNHTCQICSSKVELEVHHLTYYKNGVSIVGNESNNLDCLICLCSSCHSLVHKTKTHRYNPLNSKK